MECDRTPKHTHKKKERASRQTHTQGNNKNKEGKQHRNKT
jgi:hypothetical protein